MKVEQITLFTKSVWTIDLKMKVPKVKLNWRYELIFALTLFVIITFWQTKLMSQTQEECGFRDAINHFWQQKQPESRPVLQDEQIIPTTHFLIHYSLTDTAHATTLAWAQAIATYAEESWSVSENLGWELPPPDNGNGGDDRYDIYIVHTPGYNGITWWEDLYPTPYPNGYSSWIEVRNDSFNDPYVGEFERLRVLIAHEFHHACQLRYVLLQSSDAWFYENTSVLMEKVIYPQINYLQYRLLGSNSPLLVPEWAINHQLDGYPYPGGLWALFINEYYEDDTAVRKVWETEGNNPSMDILNAMNQSFQQYYNSDLVLDF
ncbi:MAG: hypothetical protein D6732_10345 [Methanobacteriota archaeon]|nr:MAG: hypothetical protein D6732_10345 [Euryarchaeota archaeon]